MPEPGLYLINSTGETVALATESGVKDSGLLDETVDELGIRTDICGSDRVNTDGLIPREERPARKMPEVKGECPSCGGNTLFLGSGGHVTCVSLNCTEPAAPAKLMEGDPDG